MNLNLVNESDRFVIVKAAKALAIINVINNIQINISLGLTVIEEKRVKETYIGYKLLWN
jgi:hypothetical protein